MDERETVKCGRCGLAQFVSGKRICRRCGVSLPDKVPSSPIGVDESCNKSENSNKPVILKVKVSALERPAEPAAPVDGYDPGAALERQALQDLAQPAVPLKVSVASRLVVLRRMRGHSQESLAKAAGFHRVHIGKIESMTHSPTLETLERLAEALEFPMALVLAPMREFAAFVETERRKGVA